MENKILALIDDENQITIAEVGCLIDVKRNGGRSETVIKIQEETLNLGDKGFRYFNIYTQEKVEVSDEKGELLTNYNVVLHTTVYLRSGLRVVYR